MCEREGIRSQRQGVCTYVLCGAPQSCSSRIPCPPPSYHPYPQLDRVWGRGDGAMLKPKFTGIAVFVARVTAPYTRLLGVYKHSFGASEGSKGGALLVFRSFSEGYHRRLH